MIGTPLRFSSSARFQRSLTAELHDYALRLFFSTIASTSSRVSGSNRGGRSVVVRRNSLRIAIHHDGFETIFAQCERGVQQQ